jgi:hypothetical protein
MNILPAFGVLLLGVGLGGLLVWLQQNALRRQFREDLEALTDQAFSVDSRREGLFGD